PYLRDCQERSIREASLCLCVSQTWEDFLQKQYPIEVYRVTNGVNTQRFSEISNGQEAALKQRLGLQGAPIYLTIGGLEPRKNSIALLEAFAQVLRDFPEAQLVIAGGATLFDYQDYRETFFQRAEELGISAPALLLPGVISDTDLPVLYRCADGFVFPSVKEGWGLVVMEAIASGLPIVTANQPPFTEFLSDAQACFVDPTNPQKIAEGMRTIAQPETARRFVAASRTIPDQYSWASSAQMHLQHYWKLLKMP
ncbi:MAG: MSMEG_0565 family glycosyltransferase, partial [Leptolyngbyaceae cyanobacterium bins.59]|nr:MSMEG_0565 family glycosyltransferase [Leptolyngbyaceae cyanobacterium bins.59]